ncbi:MAG TPA: NAD(P)-dependent oxidoreductase [Stellaceae bacterium]|jgi:putative dehydrogenase|nr:NAD(P)-dependent oxidoreductase [Stellaceae bacterium]
MASPGNVAVIGLGLMGGAIARNLAAAGFALRGFDVDAGKMAALERDGVRPSNSAAGAIGGAEIAFTSLPSVEALDETVGQLVAAPRPGLIVLEVSTFPIAAKEVARNRLAAAGMTLLDCPLSGTGAQAAVKDLAVYASGDEAAFGRCRDAGLFEGFARVTHYFGAFGNGSRMKFVANLLVSVHNVVAAEAIVLGTKAGLDPARILEVISSGAANSRIFELRGPMMAQGVYTPATATMHVLQKDSAIIAEFARSLGVATPTLACCARAPRRAHLILPKGP